MKKIEDILKAIADGKRIRILKLLSFRKLCVCEIADILGATQPAISKHLKKLKSAGLIDCEQDGFWTNYFMAKPEDACAKALIGCVNKWLNDNKIVKNDARKAKNINRKKLCCKKEER